MKAALFPVVFAVACTAIETAWADEPVVVACKFEKLPLMMMLFRGGMGADNNTLQIGEGVPVPLAVGSSLMSANYNGQEFTFSLRIPASVTVSGAGSDSLTFNGDCISTVPH